MSASQCSSVLLVVKNHTKGFKDPNFNIMKAVFGLGKVLCDKLALANVAMPEWAYQELAGAATEKVADKKLGETAQSLLLDLCVVSLPSSVLETAYGRLGKVRAPPAHEAFLKWLKLFGEEFGCRSVAKEIKPLVEFVLKVRT